MLNILKGFASRPPLFHGFDTAALWAEPHVAKQMLALHLSEETELASRPSAQIDACCAWIDTEIRLSERRLLDLGCGPGLYASRFADAGADVTGMDLSESSLRYAREKACPQGRFLCGNYLKDPLPECDVAVLIYGDICAMPRNARMTLFRKVHRILPVDGAFVLDAFPLDVLGEREEGFEIEPRMWNGFWAAGDYVGLKASFVYPEEQAALDRFLIVEQERQREVFTWLQYLSPAQLSDELAECGFQVDPPRDAVTGQPWEGGKATFALVASKR